MSKYFVNPDVRQSNFMAVSYHREWLNEIRRALGSNCTFLQHVRSGDNYFVEARFKSEGFYKIITFQIDGTIRDVDNENYLNLKKDLLNYARTEGII